MGCGSSRSLESSVEDREEPDTVDVPLESPAASLDRNELLKLSQKELQNHLQHFGDPAAKMDEIAFPILVDTVLLWNVMTQFWQCEGNQRAAAMRAVLSDGISVGVLERGLVLCGASKNDWTGLSKKYIAELLYFKLAQDFLTKVCSGGLATAFMPWNSDYINLLLPALLRSWQALASQGKLRGKDGKKGASAKSKAKASKRKSSTLKSTALEPIEEWDTNPETPTKSLADLRRLPDDALGSDLIPPAPVSSKQVPPAASPEKPALANPVDSKQPSAASPQKAQRGGLPQPVQQYVAPAAAEDKADRDAKFDAFDAELGSFLDALDEEEMAPRKSKGLEAFCEASINRKVDGGRI